MKKESSFKMKGFSGFGNSKMAKAAKTTLVDNASAGAKRLSSKIDMTLNDKLNKAVRKKSASFATPKIEAQKATGRISKKPTSLATRAFRGFKSLAKGLGRRSLGIGGLMTASTGTALGSNKSLKSQEAAARRLFNKRKKK